MNVLSTSLKRKSRQWFVAAFVVCVLVSCDSAIYDYEEDCSVTNLVVFRYDRNMKWADAFANEVLSIRLYAFDKQGTLVWQQTESGEELASEGYAITLDLSAGDYTLLAWAGLENGEKQEEESFSVPEAHIGKTRIENLCCSLNRKYEGTDAHSKRRLYPLFHGLMDVSLPDSEDGGTFTHMMSLTKNTNHVRVILQHLSGEPVDPDDFTFRIDEENGLMAHDNSLLADEKIIYHAYHTVSGTTDMDIDDYPDAGGKQKANIKSTSGKAVTSMSVAIADLSVARLTEGRKSFLTIENKEGGITARVPLVDYALLLKDGYGREMSAQDYLDRQDEYSLTFFLDERDKWIATSIIINSWKIVLDDVDFN